MNDIVGAGELTDPSSGLYRALASEFLGTMMLNFFGCGAVATQNVLAISLSFGLTVAAVVQSIGHVSGGHVNPAVTFASMIGGKVPIIRGLLYIIAQCIGAIAGSAALRALSAQRMENVLGAVFLAPDVTPVQGFGVEFFLALILVLVVCGACDLGKPDSKGVAPLMIGLAVAVGHITGVPRTGAGMNPARSLGSAVILGVFDDHWLYWVGPLLGGAMGELIYAHVIGAGKQPKTSGRRAYTPDEEKELRNLNDGKSGQAV